MTATPEILETVAPDTEPSAPVAAPAPVLITVQQVAFSTAAASMPAQPVALPRRANGISVVLGAVRRMFATSASETQAPRRDYPKRYAFLENSCMAREMDRL